MPDQLGLPDCRPERATALLQEWADNHADMSITAVEAELKHRIP